jgi:hypothetical protein
MPNFDIIIEPAALQLAAQTPTNGWVAGGLPLPASVDMGTTLMEYRALMQRSWRYLVREGSTLSPLRRQGGETLQQWCDRVFAAVGADVKWPNDTRPDNARGTTPCSPKHLLHAMAVAFAHGVTT